MNSYISREKPWRTWGYGKSPHDEHLKTISEGKVLY